MAGNGAVQIRESTDKELEGQRLKLGELDWEEMAKRCWFALRRSEIPRWKGVGSGGATGIEVEFDPTGQPSGFRLLGLYEFDGLEAPCDPNCGYREHGNGFRWDWSRKAIEQALGVMPGYVDGLEDAFQALLPFYKQAHSQQIARLQAAERCLRDGLMSRYGRAPVEIALHVADGNPIRKSDNPPASIAQLSKLRHDGPLGLGSFGNGTGRIYFLCDNASVLYVGQTRQPWPGRVLQHLSEGRIPFTRVFFMDVKLEFLSSTETGFIKSLNPPFNAAQNIKRPVNPWPSKTGTE